MTKTYAELRIYHDEQLRRQLPTDLLARISAHAESLTELGDNAVNVGASAPDFTLTNATGEKFTLATALADGPVVLSFYRGGWCPYCNIELRTLQSALSEFRARGARLVAITPESPDDSLNTTERNALEFDVLTDPGNGIADTYGLVFTVEENIRDTFLAAGTDLSGSDWRLPIAATYVVGRDSRITYAFRNGDFRERAEVADILVALDK